MRWTPLATVVFVLACFGAVFLGIDLAEYELNSRIDPYYEGAYDACMVISAKLAGNMTTAEYTSAVTWCELLVENARKADAHENRINIRPVGDIDG